MINSYIYIYGIFLHKGKIAHNNLKINSDQKNLTNVSLQCYVRIP